MKREWVKNIILILLILNTFVLSMQLWIFSELLPQRAFSIKNMYNIFGWTTSTANNINLSSLGLQGADTADQLLFCPTAVVYSYEGTRKVFTNDSKTISQSYSSIKSDISWLLKQQGISVTKDVTQQQWKDILVSDTVFIDFGMAIPFDVLCESIGANAPKDTSEIYARYIAVAANNKDNTLSLYIKDNNTKITKISVNGMKDTMTTISNEVKTGGTSQYIYAFEAKSTQNGLQRIEALNIPDEFLISTDFIKTPDIISKNPLSVAAGSPLSENIVKIIIEAFEFNYSTISRYSNTDGSEVFIENFRTISINPDGTVEFKTSENSKGLSVNAINGGSEKQLQRYDLIKAANRLLYRIDQSILGGGASGLRYAGMENINGSYRLYFEYKSNEIPIYQANYKQNKGYPVAIDISDGYITSALIFMKDYEYSSQVSKNINIYYAMDMFRFGKEPIGRFSFAYIDKGEATGIQTGYTMTYKEGV